MNALPAKHERFCLELVKDENQTQAAIRAGYSPKTAAAQASRLLKNVNIKDRLKELRHVVSEDALMTAKEVLYEIDLLAKSDARLLYDAQGNLLPIHKMPPEVTRCIKGFKTKTLVERRPGKKPRKYTVLEIQLWDKPAALRMAGQNRGVLKEKVELTGANGDAVPIRIVNIKAAEKKDAK